MVPFVLVANLTTLLTQTLLNVRPLNVKFPIAHSATPLMPTLAQLATNPTSHKIITQSAPAVLLTAGPARTPLVAALVLPTTPSMPPLWLASAKTHQIAQPAMPPTHPLALLARVPFS